MATTLKYVIKYVGDMDDAIKFHEETLTLKLRFRSPHWTEFETGETTLALHPATAENAAGTCQVGFWCGRRAGIFCATFCEGCALHLTAHTCIWTACCRVARR